jgi:hypothetical protein
MFRWLFLGALALAAPAGAADRTLIEDYSGRDCATNQATPIYSAPDLASKPVLEAADQTPVHVIGGKQFGPPVAFPYTDAEWARTWLHVRLPARKLGWAPAGVVNCGG